MILNKCYLCVNIVTISYCISYYFKKRAENGAPIYLPSGERRTNFWSVQGSGSALVWGPGAEPPDAREFSKISKIIPEANCTNAVFSPILQRNFKTMRSIFAHLDGKHNFLGFPQKCLKISDVHSMEKLNFSIFSENRLLKIETSEIISFFYNIFPVGGG